MQNDVDVTTAPVTDVNPQPALVSPYVNERVVAVCYSLIFLLFPPLFFSLLILFSAFFVWPLGDFVIPYNFTPT